MVFVKDVFFIPLQKYESIFYNLILGYKKSIKFTLLAFSPQPLLFSACLQLSKHLFHPFFIQ